MGHDFDKVNEILIHYTKVLEDEVVKPATAKLNALRDDSLTKANSQLITDLVVQMENKLESIKSANEGRVSKRTSEGQGSSAS